MLQKAPKGKMFPVKCCIPPGYYTLKARKRGVFKPATGSMDTASIIKAEGIAMVGVQISGHPRVKAWEPSDIEKL